MMYKQKENSGGAQNSLESLDDLFDDDLDKDTSKETVTVGANTNNVSSSKPSTMAQDITDSKENDEKDAARQAELLDIQKELEAKFDELFGSIDD